MDSWWQLAESSGFDGDDLATHRELIGDRPRFIQGTNTEEGVIRRKWSGLAFCARCAAGIMKTSRPDSIPSAISKLLERRCETKSICRNVNPEFLF